MHHCGAFKPLISSLCKNSSSWQTALAHYQRSVVEVGSSFELEHAQRIALLFLKERGKPGQLSSWARMFSFEDVPTCSLMLKALVSHGLWRSAINLWSWNPHDAIGETLLDELVTNDLWEQAIDVLNFLITKENSCEDNAKIKLDDIQETNGMDSDVALALNDAFRLANDPTFIPAEEKCRRGALPHLVNKMFPLKSQWQEAISLLVRLNERDISSQTRKELLDLAAARSAYQGEKLGSTFHWIKETDYVWHSKSLQRTFFRCAVALHHYEEAIYVLELLSKEGLEEIPPVSLHHFCEYFIEEYNQGKHVDLLDRFVAVVLKCSSRIYSEKQRVELKKFFRSNAVDTTALDVVDMLECTKGSTQFFSEKTLSEDIPTTATEIDKAASVLLHKGHWKAALELFSRLVETKPLNEKEGILIEAARASLGSWKTAILFIA